MKLTGPLRAYEVLGISSRTAGESAAIFRRPTCTCCTLPWNGWRLWDRSILVASPWLRKYVRSHQPMHLHCFTGNKYVVERWLEVFPRTFFGFTNLAGRFDENQIAALCSLEESRLLLESDSPNFPIRRSEVSSPSQLWAAAEVVATHNHLTPERMLEITLANGQYLYHRL